MKRVPFKYCISGLLLCAAASSASAAAVTEEKGWYMGASAGRSAMKMSGDAADELKEKKTGTGFKVFGGYQFNRYWGLEGQYIQLATAKYDLKRQSYSFHTDMKMSGVAINAVGILPLGESFSLLGKLGAAQMLLRDDYRYTDGDSGSYRESKTMPLIGFGAEYKLTPALALRAEYEYYGQFKIAQDTKISSDMLSIGMRYTF